MRTATIEKLKKGELVFGTPTAGEWYVREFGDDVEVGGCFFETKEGADGP
jgi:hypothetical protein